MFGHNEGSTASVLLAPGQDGPDSVEGMNRGTMGSMDAIQEFARQPSIRGEY